MCSRLIAEHLPFIFLATPNVLAAANPRVGNFHPAVLDPYTLWNADELYIRIRHGEPREYDDRHRGRMQAGDQDATDSDEQLIQRCLEGATSRPGPR